MIRGIDSVPFTGHLPSTLIIITYEYVDFSTYIIKDVYL